LPGENNAAENAGILWGDPGKDGVQLGILGLQTAKSITIGKSIPIEIFLRNAGKSPVKLSLTPRLNECLQAWLVDGMGTKHQAGYKFAEGWYIRYRHCRLESGQSVKIASPEVDFLASKEDIQNAAHKQGFEWNPRFAAPPGAYTLHFDYRVGSAEYAERASDNSGPEKVEWTGLLSVKPIALTVAAP
jgi:hypothetical protein